MAKVVKAPEKYETRGYELVLFLAGSIEQGQASPWQEEVVKQLADVNILLLNPRREDWNADWEQSIENDKFREQVEWELQAQSDADFILMHFEPDTKSPITLLELGIFKKKCIVHCPEGFWRKGNVDVVCNWFNIPQVDSLDEFINVVKGEKDNG